MDSVILTTGGTGGHIFPALAVGEEIRRRNPAARILFIGSRYGLEAELVEKARTEFAGLPVRGLLGRGFRGVPAAARMAVAFFQALGLVRGFAPQVVAGFGGYASFAPVLAATVLKKPVLIHEQNAVAGSSNRFLARRADTVCVSLENTQGFADKKCVLTGNPVRASIFAARRQATRTRDGRRLLVFGGSQGAHGLNRFVMNSLPELMKHDVQILHQCGTRDLDDLRNAYTQNGYDAQCVVPFIEDMTAAYEWADLVLCRSGASTVAELAASGTPAVLVPFPAAIHDHQTVNAQALVQSGAAQLVPESRLAEANSLATVLDLLNSPETLARMASAALENGRQDAAARIADELENLAAGSRAGN